MQREKHCTLGTENAEGTSQLYRGMKALGPAALRREEMPLAAPEQVREA